MDTIFADKFNQINPLRPNNRLKNYIYTYNENQLCQKEALHNAIGQRQDKIIVAPVHAVQELNFWTQYDRQFRFCLSHSLSFYLALSFFLSLSIYLSSNLSIHLSIYLLITLSLTNSIYLSIYIFLSLSLLISFSRFNLILLQ